ncbi:MAG: VWA domain-containing protein [Geminicoccaceae bacterium]
MKDFEPPGDGDGDPRAESEGGLLAVNVMHFARALRAAGLPVGPGKVIEALRALEKVGIGDRRDFYWTLHALFVNRADQRDLFDQTFHIFWRDPKLLERLMQLLLPTLEGDGLRQTDQSQVNRRVAEAMAPEKLPGKGEAPEDEGDEPPIEIDAAMTYSAKEVLQHKDFEEMSQSEIEQAKKAIERLTLPVPIIPTRRFMSDPHGARIDMRRTLRASLRGGGATIDLLKKRRRFRPPPLVLICDISGSMSRYSRMLLHFMHTLTNDRDRVHSFLFGTRLTNITRQLRNRDIDLSLEKVGELADDWEGGTRIGHCLATFNRDWSRRVLGQGAIVMLITDGLDRDGGAGLEHQMQRLTMSCRRTIWLNPLLRFDRYEPLAGGARIIVRYADTVRSIHNLDSLSALTQVLSDMSVARNDGQQRWESAA